MKATKQLGPRVRSEENMGLSQQTLSLRYLIISRNPSMKMSLFVFDYHTQAHVEEYHLKAV